jgi:uncharacterized protein YlxW (UPF0749 family)
VKKNIVVLTLITVLSGFFFVSVYNYQLISNIKSNPQRNSSLVRIIENLELEIEADQERLNEMRSKIENMELQLADEQKNIQTLRNELSQQKKAAGLIPLQGTGIKVVLDDNKDGLSENPESNPNNYIVHYESLLALVEEIKRAGAEAISINEQRLITNSDIRCVGNVILVNTTRIAPPFEISAIGNPLLIEKYILNSSEYDFLLSSEIPVSYELFTDENVITVPSYKSNITFSYTQLAN